MLARLKEFYVSRLFGYPPPSEKEMVTIARIQWKNLRTLFLYSLIICIVSCLPIAIATGTAVILWPGLIDNPLFGNDRILGKAIGIVLLLSGIFTGLLVVHSIERKANPAQSFRQTLRRLFFSRTAKDILAELRGPKNK